MNTPEQERAALAESDRRVALIRAPKAPRACPPHSWFLQSGSPAGLRVVLTCHGACGQTREIDRGVWEKALAGGADPLVDAARAQVEVAMEMPVTAGGKAWVS